MCNYYKTVFILNKKYFNVNLNKFVILNSLTFILIFKIFKMIILYKILTILHSNTIIMIWVKN